MAEGIGSALKNLSLHSDSSSASDDAKPSIKTPIINPDDPDEVLRVKSHSEIVRDLKQQNDMPNRSPTDFYFLKILGEGAFSTVYLARDVESNVDYAIKVMGKEKIRRDRRKHVVVRERDIVAVLSYGFRSNPFVLKLFCTFQDPTRLFFVFDYAQNGELYDLLRRMGKFDEEMSLFYASEIFHALTFIHSCRIVHRDLKPENILIRDNYHVVISDFGSAKLVTSKEQEIFESEDVCRMTKRPRGSFVGTAHYISPEVLKSFMARYEADYWALGAIIFQMLTGYAPFKAPTEHLVLRRVMALQYEFPKDFPPNAKDLVSRLLVPNPHARLGAIELGGPNSIRDHPYFANVDWDEIAKAGPTNIEEKVAAKSRIIPPEKIEITPHIKPGLTDETLTRLLGFTNFDNSQSQQPLAKPPLTPKQINALKLSKQKAENAYHRFVNNNLIIKHGFIDKKKGLFARRRMFLLTEGPHLYYVDPVNKELRGEVPFSKDMRVEAKNFRSFYVHVPGRTYILFDADRNAKDWCDAIEEVRDRYFPPSPPPSTTPTASTTPQPTTPKSGSPKKKSSKS